MGAEVTLALPVVDANKEVIGLSASAVIDTTFMRVLGYETMNVSSTTEVTRQTTSMDVVLSMDMSGSMGWDDGSGSTRIASARGAAGDLVEILYGDDTSKEFLQIGMVPWNGKVNVK